MGRPLLLAVLTAVCFAAGALAQPCATSDPTCTLQLMAPPPGPTMAGYYIDPYTALVGAAGQTVAPINGVSTSVICDDFEATINTSTPPWQANQISLGTLLNSDSHGGSGSTAVKFDQNQSAAAQAEAYVEGAYLATQIFAASQVPNSADVTAQGEYTYAIWELFDPGVALTWLANQNNDQGAAAAQAGIYLNNALQFAQGFNGDYSTLSQSPDCQNCLSMLIYTPTQQGIQELDAFDPVNPNAVLAPEPSAPALLAVYLSSLLGLILVFRRRTVRAAS